MKRFLVWMTLLVATSLPAQFNQFGAQHRAGDQMKFLLDAEGLHDGSYVLVLEDTQEINMPANALIDSPVDNTYYSLTVIVHAVVVTESSGRKYLEFTVPQHLKDGGYYEVISLQEKGDALKHRLTPIGFWFRLG